MSDSDWLLGILGDGEWHTLAEILRRSFDERGVGLTVHSRVSDLRKRGHAIEWEKVAGIERGRGSRYRLVPATLF